MRQARLLPLVLGVLLTACGKDGVPRPWPQAPAVALDLKMHVAAGDGGDGEHVELLQPVTVTLDLFRRRDLEVEFAPTVDAADFLATTAVQPEVELGSGRWQRTVLTLRPLRGPGELEIPAFVAKATDGTVEVRTEAHRLVVASVLAGHGGEL
ncbi:MAG: hypothetical protein KDE27_03115, partial [Planctomycetes bacterium]|nr:hypothetical protein [Planctomycetota bacterium]